MAAPEGNKFWEARTSHGRDKIFSDPDILWAAAVEYFEWVETHPLWENKVAQFQGVPIDMPLAKMRAMTLDGLHLFLDISSSTWTRYRIEEDYQDYWEVVAKVEKVIRDQKFSGAAADLLNANIIARDLGLKDASTSEHSGPGGGPLQIQEVQRTIVDPQHTDS